MKTKDVLMTVTLCGMLCQGLYAVKRVRWINQETALHFECVEMFVASCATMPEGEKYWAYCAWREKGTGNIFGGAPEGYLDCETNDSSGKCTLAAKAQFGKNYADLTATLVDEANLTQAPDDVQPADPAVYALWKRPETRQFTRYLHFDDIPGNGTLGNYTREAKARFKFEVKSDGLMTDYTREGGEVKLSKKTQMKTWLVWHVLNGKPAGAKREHVKKRYCGRNGGQYELYECRQTGGLQAAAGVAEGEAAAMGTMGTVQNTGVALGPGTASSGDVTGGKPIVGPTGPLVPAPPPVEAADEPGYGWVKIGTLPSDVYYTSTAP